MTKDDLYIDATNPGRCPFHAMQAPVRELLLRHTAYVETWSTDFRC